MQARPRRRADVTCAVLDDELIVYDPLNGQSFILNQTGRLIWERCDGEHTIDDMAEETARIHGVPFEQSHADITELLESLDLGNLLANRDPERVS